MNRLFDFKLLKAQVFHEDEGGGAGQSAVMLFGSIWVDLHFQSGLSTGSN